MLRRQSFPQTRPSLLGELRADGVMQQSAWREFFERYAPPVYRVARMQGLDAHDADDIVQQSMLQVARGIGSFRYDADRGRFRSWVRTIAERKIVDLRRRRAVRKAETLNENTLAAADTLGLQELWEREWQMQDMLWCLDQVAGDFSPRRMEAFRLYVFEGVSAAEVAKRMEMSVGHVYVVRAQVINKVRARMKVLEED